MGRYHLGTLSLGDVAERMPDLRRPPGDKEKRTAAQYMNDLIAETVRSLHKSPSWRAGRPLKDHRGECDCPRSLAGCVERQGWPTNTQLGARNPDNERFRPARMRQHEP